MNTTDSIRYEDKHTYLAVYLGSKRVGSIHHVPDGYQYRPKGGTKMSAGEVFPSIAAVKRSLVG